MVRLICLSIVLFFLASCSDEKNKSLEKGCIALLSDFGYQDSYVGEMKGVILTQIPEAQLVDLTHQIELYDVRKGAVVLSGAASSFPSKTIFIAAIGSGFAVTRTPILLLTKEGKYYIGPDNGVFTLVAEREGIDRVWALDKVKYFRNGLPASSFHGRDIYAPVAAALAGGESPGMMGTPLKKIDVLSISSAKIIGNTLSGEVLYVDRYGNVITNISVAFATNLKMGALVKVGVPGGSFSAPYVETYSKVATGRPLILKNSQGLIEISLNQGSLSKTYNIKAGSQISFQP